MKFILDLDDKTIQRYAEFLGCEPSEYLDTENFSKNEYMIGRLKEDIYDTIDRAVDYF